MWSAIKLNVQTSNITLRIIETMSEMIFMVNTVLKSLYKIFW